MSQSVLTSYAGKVFFPVLYRIYTAPYLELQDIYITHHNNEYPAISENSPAKNATVNFPPAVYNGRKDIS